MPSALPLDPPQRLVRTLGSQRGHAGEAMGEAGEAWLAELPSLLKRVLEEWELMAERVVSPGGRSSLVMLVRQADGGPAALKLLAPYVSGTRERTEREAAALTHWDGRGAVRLLRSDAGEGALLLERLHGEMSLRSLPEAKAMLEAASAVRRLWISPPGGPSADGDDGRGGGPPAVTGPAAAGLPTVAEHTEASSAFLRSSATPEEVRPLRDEALELRDALLADPPELVLLHGDFRQGAVLAADSGRAPWLATGPDPLLGERTYDLARLVRDRLHDLVASPGAASATRRRLHKLADSLEVDRERLRGWSLYRAVESGVRHISGGSRQDGELLLEFAGWL
ncbi:aminoglycoside phosphotransferase family protein [Streptomyces marispadix]|uniref:Aminoglycoside phosphotransferase family protein n=1 Tax=Streptomyces marispadix TaxID=2922868 RepID=A0ABS9T334_9ACTN|nr:aminoglycoside phosphotransferase family protein [Streptomyces marispadix]MCH6162927.1 aminoglycoside phosphotransferase family protein [Streptomyces marispadix]